MNQYTFEKSSDQAKRIGWTYYIDIYDSNDNTKWFRISIGGSATFSLYLTEPEYKVFESDIYQINSYSQFVSKLKKYYDLAEE